MDSALLHACDVNMWVANAAFLGTSAKGEVLETHDLFITNCGLPATVFNRAFLKEPGGDLAAACERAEAYFRGAELPFAYTVRSDREAECAEALRAAGTERQDEMPGMVLDPIRDESQPLKASRFARWRDGRIWSASRRRPSKASASRRRPVGSSSQSSFWRSRG